MQRDDHLAASFQLSEPIKQFCLEALRAAGEETRCRSRYAEAIAQFIERNQAQLNSAARKEAMAVLIERMDDINAALAWGLASGDLTTTVRIATGMQHAWAVVVHWSIGLRWLREIVAAIDRSGFDDDEAVTALMLTTGLVALHAEHYDESRQSFERAVELAERGIRVNSIPGGAVETAMHRSFVETDREDLVAGYRDLHPLGFGQPDDVASAVAFLLSDASCWITGIDLPVDGGYAAK